jgi:Transposase DDE domain
MSLEQVYQLYGQLMIWMPHLGHWQLLDLGLYCMGVIQARQCAPSRVAEVLTGFGKADSVQRRLERFLDNRRIDWQLCCKGWSRLILSRMRGQAIVLLVDETKLKGRLSVMVVGLAYRQSCIPLAFWCYLPKHWPMKQVDLIMTLLSWVAEGVPTGVIPVVEVDRGIGTSPTLMRRVAAMNWHFLFRVRGDSKMSVKGRPWRRLDSMVKLGESWSGKAVVFKKRGLIEAYVHIIWDTGYKDPWCLVTNAPHLTGRLYAQRTWQEASFRDLKSDGWQWQGSRIWTPDHANRLVLVMSIAYAWVLTLGTWAMSAPDQRTWVTKGRKHQTYSLFRLGLRYWQHLLLHAHALYFYFLSQPLIHWKHPDLSSSSLPASLSSPLLPKSVGV